MKKIIFLTIFILQVSYALSQNINPTGQLERTYKDFYVWRDNNELAATDDSVLTVLGRWAWGPCNAVDADSNFAYIGNGPTFHVLGISEGTSPKIIGEYLTDGYVYDIELKGALAFVCIGRGLLVLDIANPFVPKKISEINIGGIAISIALENNFAYVTTFSGILRVVDISNPSTPYLRGSISAGGMIASCVEAKDKQVYVGNPEFPDLALIDATNPDTLRRTFLNIGGWSLTARIKDTLLFLGVRGISGKRYLKIYNVVDAKNPKFLVEVEISASLINGITVSKDNKTAYFLAHDKGIYSIDISDIRHPKILDKYKRELPVDIGNVGICISKNLLFAAYYNGLSVVDVSKPDSLKLTSFFTTGGFAQKVSIKGDKVFLASGLSGLWILDVSESSKPKPVANVGTGGFTEEVIVEDTLAYFINWAAYSDKDTLQGLWIADISDIYKPKILSHYTGIVRFSYTKAPNSIAKSGNLIFITQVPSEGNNTILEIVDVSNPSVPKRVSTYQNDYTPYDIAVKDSVAFVATSDKGLKIIDTSSKTSPIELSGILKIAFGVVVRDTLAYTSTAELSIVNVKDTRNPFIQSSIPTHYGSSFVDLAINESFIYWVEGELGVVDVSDPRHPKEVAKFWGSDWGTAVTISGRNIYFSDRTKGLWILRNNIITSIDNKSSEILPKGYLLQQNYPNPFNPETTIEFYIPQRKKVEIEIFNLLGQKIVTLLNSELENGIHKIKFNSSGLSSGVYFYRMRTKEKIVTKKMVVMR